MPHSLAVVKRYNAFMPKNLYRRAAPGTQTRWASFENPGAGRGAGATSNQGAKGHAFDWIAAGEVKTLLHVPDSAGIITRIWMTVDDRTPEMLRSLQLEMFWDGAQTPAVSAPVGDFFGVGLGRTAIFENELFSSPEGRSFNCFIPMPFRSGARITLTNRSGRPLRYLFYDVNFLLGAIEPDALYFHAHFRRESPNGLGKPYTILPRVSGTGRFLGCNFGVIADAAYETTWWGEGEFKAWLDGDAENPTLCGTGAEDYIGTAWGQGVYAHRTQGCLIADSAARQWAMYRFHTDDPMYFSADFRAAIDAIGGAFLKDVLRLRAAGVPLIPVTLAWGGGPATPGDPPFIGMNRDFLIRLRDVPDAEAVLTDPTLAETWCNFYRQDDWSSVAYFYLDRPENDLSQTPLARAFQ